MKEFNEGNPVQAFVSLDNNLYFHDVLKDKTIQVTNDGVNEKIFNGIADWVYEEEIFMKSKAFEWSPDGKYLAFYKFDDSDPGHPNPYVSLHVYSLEKQTLSQIDLDKIYKKENRIVNELVWIDSERFVVRVLNRIQNESKLILIDVRKLEDLLLISSKIYEIDGWIDSNGKLKTFKTKDGKIFLLDLNNYKNYNRVYLIDVTQSSIDHSPILLSANENDFKYFAAAKPSATNLNLFASSLDGKELTQVTSGDSYYTASFNPTLDYYFLHYEGPKIPKTYLKKMNDPDNKDFEENIKGVKLPSVDYIQIPSGKLMLNVKVLYPPGFNATLKNYYPVFIQVYNGPSSQMVTKEYSRFEYGTHLASAEDIIVAYVDGRGTANRGKEFKMSVYKKLGKYESEDQIAAAKWFSELPFVRKSCIAIQGWSYGGFVAAKVIEANSPYVRIGVSVAPVTNWKFYGNEKS
ncbi:dipeptidyl peptidase IV/CD26, N-terminal domain-containing protein [Rozella allomycis CSF55]|uniref:Dipeptidyl peptidase IV/CD26, N-terminal domain-containing protein n=1 Tax=Rozella allomycis (strain CSF55) TaxID=988480 RepID=A0A4V1IZN4_ROZAC|nr:dipeptidyl peptidase IV/CD26, N-terminal domain-containing protein [Rozella allomycis CSF55]